MRAHGFRDYFNPLAGCFSPFPHGTCSLSVSRECLALPGGPGGFAQGYSCPALLRVPLCFASLRVRGCHPLWPDFPDRSARETLATARPYNPRGASPRRGFGLAPVRSPLLGGSLLSSLPAGTKMFQFPALASTAQKPRMAGLLPAGFSHSGTPGSMAACAYPGTIAACRALRRLREPRHPPCALTSFPRTGAPDKGAPSLPPRERPPPTRHRRGGTQCPRERASDYIVYLRVTACQRSHRPKEGRKWRITDSNR